MVSDDFNRADAGDLGANWTELTNGGQIISNSARGASASYEYQWCYWSANTWNDDQSSQCDVGTAASLFDEAPIVRAANNGGIDGYMGMAHHSVGMRIYRRDNGSFTLLQDIGGTVTSGDTIKLEIAGSTLKYSKNGAQQGTDQSDATYASGNAGISLSSVEGTNSFVDNWVGTGEVAGGFDPADGFPWAEQLAPDLSLPIPIGY